MEEIRKDSFGTRTDIDSKLEMSEEDFKKLRSGQEADIIGDDLKYKEDLMEAYRNIIDILKEYLDLKEEQYNIIALWIIGTYFHDKFPSYPYLFFNAMKGSGKSRAMALITTLSKDGQMLNSLTEAVLFRTKGALAIDEFEGLSRKGNESLRELLNSAYKKGIKVKRMKQKKTDEGTEQVVEEFEVFRPIVLANIWGMENVLGDRCIQLILEKSSKNVVTNLIEIFREEEIVKSTVEKLVKCSLCRCSFSLEAYKKWNNYIKDKYNNNTNNTNYTYYINNINYTDTFKTISLMNLNGRELELSLPLCLIANEISEDLLKETTLTLKEVFHSKKEDEITDNIDVSLYDFISQEPESSAYKWESVNDLTRRFREFMDSNEEWINTRWMGRALKRLDLAKEKRRVARGSSVILNYDKAKKKIRMFK